MHPIAILDLVSLLASLTALIILWQGWKRILKKDVNILLTILLAFTVLYNFCLFMQWSGITLALDSVEDLIGALVPMLWAFVFYAFLQEMASRQLVKTEAHYRTILECVADGYYEVDLHGNFTFVNDALCNGYGYSKEELIGMNNRQYMDEENARKIYRIFNKVYKTGDPLERTQWQIIKKDGSEAVMEVSGALIKDSNGKPMGFRGISRDITERMMAEEALRESEIRYRTMLESIDHGYYEVDLSGEFSFFNDSMCKILGYSREELMGMHCRGITDKEGAEKLSHIYNKVLGTGKPRKEFDLEIIRKDGSKGFVNFSVSLMTDSKGEATGFRGIGRDIYKRKLAETALRKAKTDAENANKTKSEFLANMSHEIRTPMNAVTGFTDMLLDTDLDDEQMDYAITIKKSGEALLSLIDDILDFSKIEAKELDFEVIAFDPELLAYDVCGLIRPKIGLKSIELLCRIGDNVPSNVKGDPLRFRQVLTNLMGNAAKFTQTGEIELSLDIEEEKEGRVKFHTMIRDTGIGIPNDKLDSIFVAFQQADGTMTRRFGGTGLGLAICKQIAALMDGDIWAESEPDQGSIFHFTAWLEKGEDKEVKRVSPVLLADKKALIIDDNLANLEILASALERVGMKAVTTSQGDEVIPVLEMAYKQGEPFDVCLTDIQMPGMTGFEIAKYIRDPQNPFSDLPMIAISSALERDAKKCEAAGIDGFLSKPIRKQKLYQMVERIIGEREERSETHVAPRRIMTQYSVREDLKHSVHVLLAEDNPVNQKLAQQMLTKAGYQVEVASNGEEAVRKFITSPADFDLIFMDIQMPEMGGIEATKAIREKGFASIPVVAMTAHAMKGDREMCLEAGMDDYIPKPIKRENVFEILEKWVLNKEAM